MSPVDAVHPDDITHLARHRGPALSIFIPTARHGPETQQGPIRLRNLARSITSEAEAAFGAETAAQLLAPVWALADDRNAWQHQAEGLAIFTSPTEHRHYRLPITFDEDATIGERFRVRPLVGHLVGDEVFYILALARDSLRLFEATMQGIDELPAEALPASMDDALRYEDPERQLRSQSVGGGNVQFHGHGAGEELDKEALARYFRVVDRGVVEALGATTRPVVLACVDYYLPIYRDITNLHVVETAVSGNPEHRSAAELHSAALPLVAPIARQRATAAAAHYQDLTGTGRTVSDLAALTAAAGEGRIDTLLIAAVDATPADPAARTAIDQVVADAIDTGATVSIVEPPLIDGPLAAILRY